LINFRAYIKEKIMKIKSTRIVLLVISVFLLISSAYSQTDTKEIIKIDKKEMAEKVKKEFLHAWKGYKKYAWGHDFFKPLSKTYKDWYSKSLLITPIDAFDVLMVMGLKKEAKEAKKLILSKLTFDLDIEVHHFEICIRLLGGLLSAYELDGDKGFLKLAKDLGDRMVKAFDSKTGMPYRNINLKTGKGSINTTNPAEAGTYLLEYGTLSKLTGNPVYFEKAKKSAVAVFERRSKLDLPGMGINIESGEWINKSSHISGCIDSYFEYLLKAAILFKDNDMRNMWEISVKAINTYLADETENGLWYGHVDMDTGKINKTLYGSLDAFFGAVLALGGDLERAKKLQESNFKMWKLHGIEPEQMDYKTMTVLDSSYELRPENIESAYYLYQYTKDEKYLEMGKEMFESIVKYCRTETGYTALKNMVSKTKNDFMDSYFLAETMKYAYLLFADEKTLDFKNTIFTTEAHPLRIGQ
jgi:ER degradation enhancer, mannosidase alpha-like 2